ncbi:LEAF RUST 10 DISEASE-RESISTANCE LOCUS RECEPTOR-LIKE PROTEIN KINASE-like 1.3 [Cryptomeria japonica]|uniref:LEAF RUST 10 DISEASE-RESISTANCE LOCUS RECEPTOR-LIKE PROTEIN KINASE-like 1.3 n=1 Tax=Cryptomeria japonica TaxID=3369 RepID=UPI0027DA11C0|nr:LEAF RUST 10 DISEASE-RESISTANCE LOCUS RECEPTOR-LIKE PROTEIN KINASE-like 1.3 [Cryptomeria japonica]
MRCRRREQRAREEGRAHEHWTQAESREKTNKLRTTPNKSDSDAELRVAELDRHSGKGRAVQYLQFIGKRKKGFTCMPNANADLPVMVPNNVRTRSFSIEELRTVTQNFSQEIGKGGFGTVFYGKLLDGKEIAVKALSSSSKQGVLEFLNEIDLLSRVSHKNLVWLLGYCTSSKELMLVYEYVGGGSLRDHLHGSLANSSALDWKARIRVALDAAEGTSLLFCLAGLIKAFVGFLLF